MNRKKKKVVGAIAIEAVLSLTIFMLAILALMMGSLLMRAQSSMQYALNQTAKEISGYFYLLDKFGIASMLSENTTENADADLNQLNTTIGHIFAFSGDLKGDAKTIKKQITETNEKFQSGSLTKEDLEELKAIPANEKGKIEASIDEIKDDIELLKSTDKKVLFKAVIQVFSRACINTAASKYLTPFVCKALMPKYLTDGDVDTYYNSIGVIPTSINFDGSHILGDGRTISLVVEYQIDASKLTLGFYKKNLTFRQVAVTSAWIQKNESGSLQDLKTVGKYFNEGYVKEHAEELKLLKEKNDAEAAEAEKKAKEEAEAVSKALTKSTTTTTTTTTTTKVTEKSEDTTTTTTTTAPLTKEAEEFLKKYPQCKALYEKYGPDVIKAVNKCSDPNAAITLLLNAEKGNPAYGEEAVAALKKGGDDAVSALNKVPSKECAQVVAANGSRAAVIIAANGKDAVTAIGNNDSPIDAIKAIERANNATDRATVIQALNLAPTQDCAVAIMRCKDATAAEAIIAVGKDRAVEAADAINNSEDLQSTADAIKKLKGDALDVFEKVKPITKACTDALKDIGIDAAIVFIEYGNEAVELSTKFGGSQKAVISILKDYGDNGKTLLKDNGISPEQIRTLESHGLNPDVFAANNNRHVNNADEAQKLIDSYNTIHSEFTEKEIQDLKDKVVNEERRLKRTIDLGDVGPAVAGVYNKKTGQYYFKTNAKIPDGEKTAPTPKGVKYIEDMIKNMPDDVKESYKRTSGAGSHAEVYAVAAALADGADIDDLLVYVNYTGVNSKNLKNGTVPDGEYNPFVTCPHCEYILQQLKVVSNVEI